MAKLGKVYKVLEELSLTKDEVEEKFSYTEGKNTGGSGFIGGDVREELCFVILEV